MTVALYSRRDSKHPRVKLVGTRWLTTAATLNEKACVEWAGACSHHERADAAGGRGQGDLRAFQCFAVLPYLRRIRSAQSGHVELHLGITEGPVPRVGRALRPFTAC